ncbi:hypothetical protein BASA50_006352 [Batrachochytrium salamandrivorans]|uniref:Uncharacterized protein n=1 Tax=Batrachochytrium salamandrivorans TaxID=1357716 RepID=A0ABQ8F9X8_9FUNG|nr:hypothetical protein BASA60_004867 [Batrachochytrium salamandrivorans]KAH6594674.1 hypothetical protein BASA50_006352 [Batrachochytrium salamandrivorans]KAH6599956.1 hypothetical protein BASA61_002423 [Batrachochytrium salamandrivorans]KAH9276602.1 hypothetical protein BASA83_000731 [Batrachochytrium salamandrivorans]
MSALPISSTLDYRAFEQSLVAALILTWILFVIEFSGLLSGRTMFCTASSTIHIVAHAAGMISLSLFMTEGWHYITYWYIFIFCSQLQLIIMSVLFVGRVPEDARSTDLEEIFHKYGKIIRCDVKHGASISFGFVEYEDKRDAEDALKAGQEAEFELNGSKMYVEWAKAGGRRGGERSEGCFKCGESGHWARECPNGGGGGPGRDRGYDRGGDRGYDRGGDRGHDRGGDRGYDRGGDRGHDRGGDRGYDRGGDRGYDRGGDRGGDYDRRDRGRDRSPRRRERSKSASPRR